MPEATPTVAAPAAAPQAPVPTPAPVVTPPPEAPIAPDKTTLIGAPKEEKLELKAPDGSPLDSQAVESLAAFARANGLSQKQAQAILEREYQSTVSQAQTMEAHKRGGAEWTKRVDGWESEAKKRPSLGQTPEAFALSVKAANEALTRWFPPAIAEFLVETGYGSHPDIIEGLAKLGRAGGNDTLVRGSTAPVPTQKARTLEDIYAPKGAAQ